MYRKNILDIIPYPPGKPIKEVERELGIKKCYKLASNENLLGPSPKAVAAIRKYLKQINYYPDGSGYYIRERLAMHLNIDPSMIILGNGSDELLQIIGLTYISPKDEVVISPEGFIRYPIVVNIMDGRNVSVSMKNHRYDLNKILSSITKKTKLIFIANPNNPTGTTIDSKEMDSFIKKVPDNITVVLDEAYYEFADKSTFPDSLKYVRKNKNVIVLRTFSKIYGLAGLRIGYAVSTPEIIKNMNKVRCPFNANSLAEIAALGALEDEEHLEKTKKLVEQEKKYLYYEFNKLDLEYIPSDTNFILFHAGKNSASIFEKLLRKGIIVRPMGIYNLPEWIRVTVGLHVMNKKFIHSLKSTIK